MVKILYEDNHLIAVYKPAGTLVQGDASEARSLMDEVKEYIKKKYLKPGNVFLGLVHRLDRNVAGVVLFAKTSKGASRISEQFRNHSVEKIYHAWVEGTPSKHSDTLIHWLIHDERGNTAHVVEEHVHGAVRAELSYEVVDVDKEKNAALLKIILKTGRHHQIRVQCSELGHPIVGDFKYGSRSTFSDQHIELYATSLTFSSATGTDRHTVSIDIPTYYTRE